MHMFLENSYVNFFFLSFLFYHLKNCVIHKEDIYSTLHRNITLQKSFSGMSLNLLQLNIHI